MEKTMNEVLAKARSAKSEKADRQKRYVAALEGLAAKVRAAKLPRTIHNAGIHAAATTVEQIANEIGGPEMMAMEFCGREYNFPTHFGEVADTCGDLNIACPSCLLAHIAKLEAHIAQLDERVSTLLFTNGVLDSAAKDAQAWLCRAQTAEAKCAQLEAQRGGHVQLDADSVHPLIIWTDDFRVRMKETAEAINEWVSQNVTPQAISIDRVLADGMVEVDREAIKTAIGLVRCLVVGPGSGQDALSAMESALRSAKGEVEG